MRSYAQQRSAGRSATAIGIVFVLQLGVLYGVMKALDIQYNSKVKQDVETKIVEEIKPPPPDTPPPPPPPPTQAPPPVFIPPPEIIINTPPPPAVVTAPVTVAPPAPAPIQHVEAPQVAAVPDRNVSERPTSAPPLVYPPRMQSSGREGSVDVECDVDVDGKTSNCAVVNTQGGSAFSDAAMEYVTHAKYSPKIEHGAPVKTRHKWTITFKLNG